MHHSILKKQGIYANRIAFFYTLITCLAIGLCFMFITKNNLVALLFLVFSLITVVGKLLERYSAGLGFLSKYIYLSIFAAGPPTIMYMLESMGLHGFPPIAFSFVYLFIAIMYYNARIVLVYASITLLIYITGITAFSDLLYGGTGKNAMAWISYAIAFLICVFVSSVQSNRSRHLIVGMETKEKESEALTKLLNKSIDDASNSSESIYIVAKDLSDGITEVNKAAEHTMTSMMDIVQSTSLQRDLTSDSYNVINDISTKLTKIAEDIKTVSEFARDCSQHEALVIDETEDSL